MGAEGHADRRLLRRQQRADGKAAAQPLGRRHHVGPDAGPFVREQPAGAAHARLHLVEEQQQPVFVADRAQPAQVLDVRGAHAALALHRLDQDRRRLVGDGIAQHVEIAERHVVEARHGRVETLQVLLVAGGGQRGQRAAVESLGAADDAEAMRIAGHVMVLAYQLDAAFHGFRTGIAEKHGIGEGILDKSRSQALALGNAEQVGDVPELFRLGLERGDQMRVGVAQRGDRDAAAEIEIASPVGGEEIGSLAAFERDIPSVVGRHHCGNHGAAPWKTGALARPPRKSGKYLEGLEACQYSRCKACLRFRRVSFSSALPLCRLDLWAI